MSIYEVGDVVHLELRTYNEAGAAADATDVTLTIYQPDGTTVARTLAQLTHTATGVYTYDFPPTLLGSHDARWLATGQNAGSDRRRFDVYGATIADPADLQARKPDLAAADATVLRRAIRDAVQQWNQLARVAMAPFGTRRTWLGDGCSSALLPDVEVRQVLSLKIEGVATTAYTVDSAGVLRLTSGTFTRGKQIECYYEHGLDAPPGAVVDAVLQRAVELAVPAMSGSGRVSLQATDVGWNRVTLAGRDGTTGVPDFDATAALFGRQATVGFA